ncbi:MAG: hypothetical protein RLY31_2897 [Bacteroidota bacterium]
MRPFLCKLLAWGLLICSTTAAAQPLRLEHFKSFRPRNIGPAGMSGRVTAIDVPATQPNTIYVGAASGGVWRSDNGGIQWKPLFDEMPVQSIGAIRINQRNPSEIWVGTGEGNPRNSQNSGEGVYRSIDGGKSWQHMGLAQTKTIHRIILHRDDPNTVFVAASGSAWGPHPERGVFKSTDAGKTWRKILFVNDSTGCADLVADPANPNKLIAAMWEYGRKPWTFSSGGPGSGIYVSFDGGETWTKRTDKDGLPKGDLGRIGLAIAPSRPNTVYAIVEAAENALYKSTDGGFRWQKMANANTDETQVSNRPFYYHEIYVDPKNENRIFSLWSILSKSEDGGRTFQEWAGWKIHPDHHAFWISPDDPDYIIEGNDGGLNITRDGGQTWRFVENLPLAQFYHINHDMAVPYRVGGGMQDNGSWVGPSAVWKSGGIRNTDWQEIYFGDGFDVGIRPDDGRYAYAMSQGGNLGHVDMLTGATKNIKPVHPDGKELRFNWNAAFAQDPFHDRGIYYGSQYLHRSLDCGDSWEVISPDLTTNDSTKMNQDKSGGLTIDATNAENHCTILAIGPSPVDEQVVWVGTDDGHVQLTRDGGRNWRNVADHMPGWRPGCWIPYIAPGRTAAEAFVVMSDYRRNDWKPYVYHTADFGETFRRLADENQVQGHALCIVQDPQAADLLWLGTDYGLWFSLDFGKHWQRWTNGFPAVSTYDLKIHPRDHDLIIATFGRAAWILDDIRTFRELAGTQAKALESPFRAFSATDGYLAEWRSYDGVRFTGDGMFSGANKSSASLLTLWVRPPTEEPAPAEPVTSGKGKGKKSADKKVPAPDTTVVETDKKAADKKGDTKDDKIKVRVVDAGGDTIRTFSIRADTGIIRTSWDLRQDGVRYPSRRESKPDDDPPGGFDVLPGTYRLHFRYKDFSDSLQVTVHGDPRIDIPMERRKAQQAAYREFYRTVELASDGFRRIQEARKSIDLVDKALANAPDSLRKEITKAGKSLLDSLDRLERRYMMPEGLKGIQRDPDNIQGMLWRTGSYIGSSEGAPNTSARTMMELTRREVGQVAAAINALLEGGFAAYRRQVEAVPYSLFKDMPLLRTE